MLLSFKPAVSSESLLSDIKYTVYGFKFLDLKLFIPVENSLGSSRNKSSFQPAAFIM